MKPNFALSIHADKVELLHRSQNGWDSVGTAAFDAEDLSAELSALRKTALARDPEGLRTKLILPDDQVKFLSLDDASADDAAVRSALDEATPYALDELVFEAASDGTKTHIAAVAQETLDEAEAFAVEHRFAPVSIVARLDKTRFDGEPFFGATKAATSLIGPDDTVERDSPPAALAKPEPHKADTKTKKKAAAKKEDTKKASADKDPAEKDTGEKEHAKPKEDVKPQKAPGKDKKASKDESKADPNPKDKPAPKKAEKPTDDVAHEPVFASRERTKSSVADTGLKAKAEPPAKSETTSRITPQAIDDVPPAVPVQPRTVPQPVPPRPAPGTPPPAVAERLARIARTDVTAQRPADLAPVDGRRVPNLPLGDQGKAPAVTAPTPVAKNSAAPQPKALAATLKRGDDTPDSGLFASRRKKGDPDEAETAVAAKAPAAAKATTKDRSKMTVFDERDQSPARGKPRFMLPILIAVLLLFMAVAAAFAAIFTDQSIAGWLGFGGTQTDPIEVAAPSEPTPLTESATPDAGAGPVLTLPAGTDPIAPQPGSAEQLSGLTPLDATAADPEVTPPDIAEAAPPVVTPDTAPGTVLSPAQADRFYAATGVWLRAPRMVVLPTGQELGDVSTAGTDRALITRAPAASLPAGGQIYPDTALPVQLDPPGPDVVFERDARGLLLATPQGTRTPYGMLIFAGQPNLVPPTRPGTIAPEPVIEPEPITDLAILAAPQNGPAPDATTAPQLAPTLGETTPPAASGTPQVLVAVAADTLPFVGPTATPPEPAPAPLVAVVTPEPAPSAQDSSQQDTVTATLEALIAETLQETTSETASTPTEVVARNIPLDARGLVAATAQGTQTDGLVVFAGLPAVVPPTRPGTAAPQAIEPQPTVQAIQAEPPLDTRGLVAATDEGTLTDGLIVYAGLPSIVPPTRPTTQVVTPPQPDIIAQVAPTAPVLDDRGLLVATANGAQIDGLIVYAGRPAIVPPTRPSTEPLPEPAETTEATTDAQTPETLAPEQAITAGGVSFAGLRPAQRPQALDIPQTALPVPAYSGTRPPLRPAGLAPETTQAPEPALPEIDNTTVATTLATIVAATTDPLAGATQRAVPIASVPQIRPRNFARVVSAAQARQASVATAAPTTRATQPEAVSSAAAQPSGPVPRSVAAAATIESVINLRQINLIGVYGRSNDRRALVRLANGRYVRVSVGDSLDGGQVTAIGDNVINYVKRGQTIALGVPG